MSRIPAAAVAAAARQTRPSLLSIGHGRNAAVNSSPPPPPVRFTRFPSLTSCFPNVYRYKVRRPAAARRAFARRHESFTQTSRGRSPSRVTRYPYRFRSGSVSAGRACYVSRAAARRVLLEKCSIRVPDGGNNYARGRHLCADTNDRERRRARLGYRRPPPHHYLGPVRPTRSTPPVRCGSDLCLQRSLLSRPYSVRVRQRSANRRAPGARAGAPLYQLRFRVGDPEILSSRRETTTHMRTTTVNGFLGQIDVLVSIQTRTSPLVPRSASPSDERENRGLRTLSRAGRDALYRGLL